MQFGWTNSRLQLVAMGHDDHGKTTLIAAIGKVAATNADRGASPFGRGDSHRIEFEFGGREYSISEYESGLLVGGTPVSGAILVVASTDGPMPKTRDHLIAAREARIPSLIVFLNKLDLIDDSDLLDLVELEIRELISTQGYPGDDVLVIRGSALKAATSKSTDPAASEYQSIHQLLQAIDASISQR